MRIIYFTAFILSLLVCHSCKTGLFHHHHDHFHHIEGLHHWEIPSKDPDRLILTFSGDPATSRAVTWRTDRSVETGVAQIAVAAKNSSFAEEADSLIATTEEFDLGQYKSNMSLKVHYHSVVFEDLQPNTLYAYRVGDGFDHWSEWIHFRTAKKEYAPTQFIYFGDAQNNVLAHWSRVIRKAYQTAPDASFVVHAGDLINRAHKDQEWAEWYKAGGFIHSQWTAIPVVGNHEFYRLADGEPRQLSIQWRPQFTLPVERELPQELHETVYTVDYQDIQIIVLNSADQSDFEEQSKYLMQQLENSTAKWKIVTCHHSIFSPAKGRDFVYGRENWQPIFDKYGVDLVLNGHDHTYSRGHVPTRASASSDDGGLSTIYVTSVSGPKQYTLDKEQMEGYKEQGYQLDKAAEQTQFFQTITVDNNTLTYVAYNALGEKYDQAVIEKDFTTGEKRLVEEKK